MTDAWTFWTEPEQRHGNCYCYNNQTIIKTEKSVSLNTNWKKNFTNGTVLTIWFLAYNYSVCEALSNISWQQPLIKVTNC